MRTKILFLLLLCLPALALAGEQKTLTVGGVARGYWLHLPPGEVAAGEKLPYILLLHGAGANGKTVAGATGLQALADVKRFALVCPDAAGAGKQWNAHLTGSLADDMAFLRQLQDALVRELPLDPKRCYACGYSSGASMAVRLALSAPQRIAAVAPVNGTLATSVLTASAQTFPTPLLVIIGEDDPHTAVAAGHAKSARDTVAHWVKVNGCDAKPAVETLEDGGMTAERYTGARPDARVTLLIVHRCGHDWPGSTTAQQQARPALQGLVLREIWDFFAGQTR